MSDTKYPQEGILKLSSFVQKLQLKQGEECQLYFDSIVKWRDAKNMPYAESFPIVYNMNDFAAIIFSMSQ